MQVAWDLSEVKSKSVVRAHVELSTDEVDELVEGAYERFARIFKMDVQAARRRAQMMLTENELARYLNGSVTAQAAEDACARYEGEICFVPQCTSDQDLREHEPFAFDVAACVVPNMSVDLATPIARVDDEEPSRTVERALTARLEGTIPLAHVRRQTAMTNDAFEREIADMGVTRKQYRLDRGMLPSELDSMLERRTMRALTRDLALDVAFVQLGLSVTDDDVQAALTQQAPGHEDELYREMQESGRTCLLHQEARRTKSLTWAKENLLQ